MFFINVDIHRIHTKAKKLLCLYFYINGLRLQRYIVCYSILKSCINSPYSDRNLWKLFFFFFFYKKTFWNIPFRLISWQENQSPSATLEKKNSQFLSLSHWLMKKNEILLLYIVYLQRHILCNLINEITHFPPRVKSQVYGNDPKCSSETHLYCEPFDWLLWCCNAFLNTVDFFRVAIFIGWWNRRPGREPRPLTEKNMPILIS